MEKIGAHRHPEGRACRTRYSYFPQRPFKGFLGPGRGKANQNQDTHQRDLCNNGPLDGHQSPLALLARELPMPALVSQHPLQRRRLIHQQAAQ